MFEREYRDLIHVPRWAIARTTRTQSVAEHSYFVALYASEIMRFYREHNYKIEMEEIADVLLYALIHDRSEAFMSDIPGPIKRNIRDDKKAKEYEALTEAAVFGSYASPSPATKNLIKVADLMDEYGFWWDESQMGNAFSEKIMPHVLERLRQAIGCLAMLEVHKAELLSRFMQGVRKDKHIPENNNDVAS